VYLDFGVLLAKVLCECIDLVALVVHLELFDLQLQVPLVYLLLHLVQLLLLQEDLEGLRIRQVHLVHDRCVCRCCRLLLLLGKLRRLLLLLLRGWLWLLLLNIGCCCCRDHLYRILRWLRRSLLLLGLQGIK
jgi:hypothetical protein